MDSKHCTGRTKSGNPCRNPVIRGTETCWRHTDIRDGSPRARNEQWDRRGFLYCFEYAGMISEACRLMGVGRSTVYQERQRNEAFAVAWADVEERSTERMEAEAFRRAVEGVETPLVSAGKLVTTVRTYSDGLLQFMLKARRPERYRDNVKVEHSGSVQTNTRLIMDDELAGEARALLRRAAASSGD